MALPASDAFTGGTPSALLGANWTTVTGRANPRYTTTGESVRTEALNTDSAAYWSADVFSNDQYSAVVVVAMVTNTDKCLGAMLRAASGANTFYACCGRGPAGASATAEIRKSVTGTTTIITSATKTINVSDTIRGEVSGTNLTLYVNGVSQLTTSDGAIASGSAGVFIFEDNTGDHLVDVLIGSWTGGNFTSAAVTVSTYWQGVWIPVN